MMMLSRRKLIPLACIALVCPSAFAAEIPVANSAGLNAAIAAAKPGDTLVLADGVWRDTILLLNKAGTAQAPITIRARTPGAVVFTGSSRLQFDAPYVIVDGLCFKGGALTQQDKQVVRFNSNHCRMTNSAIIDYNPPSFKTKYYWVFFAGKDNRLDHCFLTGKNHLEPLIGNNLIQSLHNTVDYCYIKDIPYHVGNGREIFRIWGYGKIGEKGEDGAFFTIAHNLLVHADGEGSEIISLKSNRNRVIGNTIRGSRGGITLRNGNYNTIDGNFVFADGISKAYGIRVTGEFHTITNNYCDNCSYGINLMAGEFVDDKLTPNYVPKINEDAPLGRVPVYFWTRHNLIANNILVATKGPNFIIGSGYKQNWPAEQRVLLPTENRITDNLALNSEGPLLENALQDRQPPLSQFQFAPNILSNNIVYGGVATSTTTSTATSTALPPALPPGFTLRDPKAVRDRDNVYRRAGNILNHPLTADEVGPDWMRVRRASRDKRF